MEMSLVLWMANIKPSIKAVFIKDFHRTALKWYCGNQCYMTRDWVHRDRLGQQRHA
jgi:hypothetical protein